MYENLVVSILIVFWFYASACLFALLMNNGYYIKNIPMMDETGTYQVYNFIPLFMITNCFDKKIYIE